MRSVTTAATFLLLVASAGCRTGAGDKTAAASLTSEDGAAGPFLWEVQGKNGPVFLFGTIHVLGGEDVPPIAVDKFTAAPALVLETNVKNVDPVAMIARGMLPANQSLDVLLGPALWTKLVTAVGPRVPEMALRRFKPWLAGALLIASVAKRPSVGMDQWLHERAVEQKKELVFLESLDDQLAVLEGTFDVSTIEETLKDLPAQKKVLDGMASAYRAGDVMTLETVIMMSYGSSRKQMEAMLDARNQRWLAAIDQLRAARGGFVAVGAGHLGGEKGLVALLRARGASVRRVLVPPAAQAPR
jgi:uncharacterized protein YbaP (TraB family)